MKFKSKILVYGIDKPFFQDKFEFINKKYDNISCYASWSPIKKDLTISKLDRIDISLLYDQENIFNAYPLKKKAVLDKIFLSEMYECESVFLSTIDRCSAKSNSLNKTKNYFNDLLIFFKSFFESRVDIDYVFFQTTPHFPVGVVLFFVSKYFSKHTIILNRVGFNNKFYFKSDWRKAHDFNHDFNYISDGNLDSEVLKSDSKFITTAREENDYSIKNFKKNNNLLKIIFDYIILLKLSFSFFKTKHTISPFHLNKDINGITIFSLLIKRYRQNKRLVKYYGSIMEKATLNVEYVFFPLHFQPERSTDPEGSVFSNQLRAIELLRESLHPSIYIYVKEHPRQFDSHGFIDLRKIHARTESFYERICSLPNTKLIDIGFDSNLLIKKAKIIATITGSSGWEAILQKKPTLVFGNPWYCSFNKCYIVEKKADIIKALIEINTSDFNIENMEIRNFVDKLEGKIFDGYIGEMYHDGKLPYKKIIESFSSNLIIYLKNLQI